MRPDELNYKAKKRNIKKQIISFLFPRKKFLLFVLWRIESTWRHLPHTCFIFWLLIISIFLEVDCSSWICGRRLQQPSCLRISYSQQLFRNRQWGRRIKKKLKENQGTEETSGQLRTCLHGGAVDTGNKWLGPKRTLVLIYSILGNKLKMNCELWK